MTPSGANDDAMRRVRRRAQRQHGRITRDELRAEGVTDDTIATWKRRGWLELEHRAVFRVGAVPPTRNGRFYAATATLGPEAVLSHRAAGALWGIVTGAVPTELLVPPDSRSRSRDGFVVRRAVVGAHHRTVRDRIPVTTLVRTVVDLAAVEDELRLARAFEQAQVLHYLDPQVLGVEVALRRGYPGTPALRGLLRGAVDPAAVRSVLELRFLRLCADHGIPRPLVNVPLLGALPDFTWPDARLVVETDGKRFHSTAAQLRRDAALIAVLEARGWTVLRLRWADVVDRPGLTAARVHAALRGGSRATG